MRDVVTAILGGGQGARLFPLTRDRAKPAVPVAGKFRLIDIPISNSIRAGANRIYVMTQFNSASLHRHIARTYRFDAFSAGFVNILAAEQNPRSHDWYQGTADAVRQNLFRLLEDEARDIVILSGDQLYLMEIEEFVGLHRERDADLTIAVKPVSRTEATGFGVMHLSSDGRITEFAEKPKEDRILDHFELDAATVEQSGLNAEPGQFLASMGIYVFKSEVLVELLHSYDGDDFGKEIIPAALGDHDVFAYVYDGYWRDIGTIGSFHQANLELTYPVPDLDLYDPEFPIYTHPRFLPGAKVTDCTISESVLCDGSIVEGARLRKTIVGVRAKIRAGTDIESTVVMGNGFFEAETPDGGVPLGIGRDCLIRNAIIDFNVRIGDGVQIVNREGVHEADGDGYHIRDGIVVIPNASVLEPGRVI